MKSPPSTMPSTHTCTPPTYISVAQLAPVPVDLVGTSNVVWSFSTAGIRGAGLSWRQPGSRCVSSLHFSSPPPHPPTNPDFFISNSISHRLWSGLFLFQSPFFKHLCLPFVPCSFFQSGGSGGGRGEGCEGVGERETDKETEKE